MARIYKNTDGQSAVQITLGVVCRKVGVVNTNLTKWCPSPQEKFYMKP